MLLESRPAQLHSLLYIAPLLQLSLVQFLAFHRDFESSAMSSGETYAVVQMARLKIEETRDHFLPFSCWPFAQNL